jgi:hypothetical protein
MCHMMSVIYGFKKVNHNLDIFQALEQIAIVI